MASGSLRSTIRCERTCIADAFTRPRRRAMSACRKRAARHSPKGRPMGFMRMPRARRVHGRSAGSANIGPGAFATSTTCAIGSKSALKCTELFVHQDRHPFRLDTCHAIQVAIEHLRLRRTHGNQDATDPEAVRQTSLAICPLFSTL